MNSVPGQLAHGLRSVGAPAKADSAGIAWRSSRRITEAQLRSRPRRQALGVAALFGETPKAASGPATRAERSLERGRSPNQSLQQTKPSVTVRACARPAPAVFAAEAGC